jgi:hypothetical protein
MIPTAKDPPMVIVRGGLDGRAKDEVWNDFLQKVGDAVRAGVQRTLAPMARRSRTLPE